MKRPTLFLLASLSAILAFLSGCANYQLGSAGGDAPQSVYVPPVEVDAYAPQAATLLTGEVKEALVESGFVHLASTANTADAVLEVTIVEYTTREIATRPDDTGRGFAFESRLIATISLRSPGGRKVYLNAEPVEAVTTVLSMPNLPDARYQALPILAEDMAKRIANRVSDL